MQRLVHGLVSPVNPSAGGFLSCESCAVCLTALGPAHGVMTCPNVSPVTPQSDLDEVKTSPCQSGVGVGETAPSLALLERCTPGDTP